MIILDVYLFNIRFVVIFINFKIYIEIIYYNLLYIKIYFILNRNFLLIYFLILCL